MVTTCTKTAKGRPALQLSPEIEETLRTSYDGSAACVHSLAQQYRVADSTIRAWAQKLGLTQRSRPRPQSSQEDHHSWKLTLRPLDEGQEPTIVPDREVVTVDLVRAFLNEMNRYPRLTSLQERQLGERSAQGDRDAKYILILANLRLVVRVAKHYAAKSIHSLPLLDLIQEGTLGLMHAVDIYDVSRGWRFSTHATWWIRQSVSRAQMEQSRTVRLPIGAQEQIQDLHELLQEAQGDLPLETITARLSISGERAQELLIASQPIHSLDTPAFGESGDLDVGHLLESPIPTPQDHIEALDLRHQLLDLVQTLRRPRDRQVITLRYGLDGEGERTLEEVGKQLHVTRERIRQIETRTLLELRQEARARQLQEYLSA
jgi:RNA polymerase primary sigma factor